MSNSRAVTVMDAGSFELPAASHLKSVTCTAIHSAVQPDAFDQHGNWYRLLQMKESHVAINAMPTGTLAWVSSGPVNTIDVQHQVERIFSLIPLPHHAIEHLPTRLAQQFIDLAPLVHISSPTLGEALIKGVIRQVISAAQARKVLHQFITCFGSCSHHADLTYYDFPTLETITHLSLEELTACGLGFKAKIVSLVAHKLLEEKFEEQILNCSSSDEAVRLLQQLKGIGTWTAHIAICDFLRDLSQYPFGDLAVRKWARLLWPEGNWPESEDEFEHVWKQINGGHTGLITLYLLTLGKNIAM